MAIPRSEYRFDLENVGLVRGGDPTINALNEYEAVRANPIERLVGFQRLTDEANVTADAQTWVVIHGFDSSTEGPNINLLEASVRRHARPNDRVLSLDWREAAGNRINPRGNLIAATWSTPVAEYVARTLQNQYSISPESASNTLNLVGHSLGAYMAGEIGKAFRDGVAAAPDSPRVVGNGVGVRTITALDPASNANNLRPGENFFDFGPQPYDMDGDAGVQAPQAFAAVSRFSRAYNGTNSIFGNEAAAATADEAIAMSFDSSNLFSEHERVVLAFANIDEQPGRIGSNLGIRAYVSTSGSLPLSTWQDIPRFPLAGSNRGYKAVLDIDSDDQSRQMFGLRNTGSFDNVVIGNEVRNVLGGFGTPTVPTQPLGDQRYSSGGADILYGEGGGDVLLGGPEADVLIGGTGADNLTGGTGSDTFVLSAGDGSINPNGTNIVNDFAVGEDFFGLTAGLSYEGLSFASVVDPVSPYALIQEVATGLYLARVDGLSATAIQPAANYFQVQPEQFEVV